MSEQVPEGSHERLVGRLRQLADAVTQGRDAVAREFTMHVPAEPERDADLVLSKAADEIDRLRAEVDALRAERDAAVAAERERCAQIVENVQGWEGVRDVAARIRA